MTGRGLAYWYEQAFGSPTVEDDVLAEMMAQPRFADACRRCGRGFLAARDSSPLLARVFRDSTRMFYAMFVLVLDARGPVTLTSLQALCTELGLASPGRAAAMLMHLRMIGYIRRDTGQPDRRVRSYTAAPEMRAAFHLFIRNELSAVALIEPAAQTIADRLDEPEVCRPYLQQLGLGLTRLLLAPESPVTLFGQRDGGMAILYHLAASGSDGDAYPPRGPVQVSVAGLARQHGVSRTHVFKLLRDAEDASLLRRDADAGTCILEQPLRDALSRLHALSFIGHAGFAWRALQAIDQAA